MRKSTWVVTLILLAIGSLLPLRRARADEVDLEKVTATLSAEIRRRMDAEGIPSVSVALVKGGEVVWTGAFGDSNVWAKTPASPDTLYSTGSTFKTVVATCILQLVEAGKLELDAPLEKALPGANVKQPVGSKPITIRHLLTHTSGLPRGGVTLPVWDRALPPSLPDLASNLVAVQAPETSVSYSNLAFAVLGRIVEVASGEGFADYARKHVFEPLGMKDTTLAPSGNAVERLAIPYTRTATGVEPLRQVRFDVYPAGDVYTTARDMGRFLAAHLEGGACGPARILSTATCLEMRKRPYFADVGTMGFGLAFQVDTTGGREVLSHSGSVPGMVAQMRGDVSAKVGVYLLANLDTGGRALEALSRIAVLLLRGEPYVPFDPAIARRDPVPASWKDLVGTYLTRNAGPLRVRLEKGTLRVDLLGTSGWLVPAEGDGFFAHGDAWPEAFPVVFVRDAKGAVQGLRGPSGEMSPRTVGDAATLMDTTKLPEGALAGDWEGVAKFAGLSIPFTMKVTKDGDRLLGSITMPAQGLRDSPVEHLLHHGKAIHFEHGGGTGLAIMDGTLEGDVVQGTLRRSGMTLPIEAYRQGSEAAKAAAAAREKPATPPATPPTGPVTFVGVWEGTLEVPASPLAIHLDVTSDTAATMDIPAQGLRKGVLENVQREGASVRFELASGLGRAVFTGTLEGDTLKGVLAQNGMTIAYTLRRLPPR